MTLRDELPDALRQLRPHALVMAGEQDADDILQTAALKALQNAHQFTPGTSLRAWLYRIMRNEFLESRRGVKSRPNAHIDDVSEHFLAKSGNQETIVLLRQVVAAVSLLKPTFQDAIAASLEDDEMHRRPTRPCAMRSRLFRARRALREAVA